jgi:hypothetical protein|tara:strand:+ start:290 stop:547 length:258 start_codon:yes stop_codon:yes gene_type:complete
MGYLYNHLATVVCAVFAGVLTLLWPLFVDLNAVYDLVFMMAVPIMWFLTAVCFVAQRSADYVHGHQPGHKSAKKLTYTSDGQVSK